MSALALPRQFGPITLLPYQEAALRSFLESLARHRMQLCFLPTGTGKSILGAAAAIVMGRVLVLVHRKELVDQWVADFEAMLPGSKVGAAECDIGVVAAERDNYHARRVVVAMVQSAARRLHFDWGLFDLVICDEAHHACLDSTYDLIFRKFQVPTLGLTATPTRHDGKKLSDVGFSAWCYRMNCHEAIRFSYLAPYEARTIAVLGLDEALGGVKKKDGDFEKRSLGEAMEKIDMAGQTARAYAQHARTLKGVIFTVTVDQARKTAEKLSALGVKAGWVSGEQDKAERATVLRDHKEGRLLVVANCGVLTEGYNDPEIECGLMARPTQSKGLYMQCMGRILRRHPKKKLAHILDAVGAHEEHGLVMAPRLSKAPTPQEEKDEEDGLPVLARFEEPEEPPPGTEPAEDEIQASGDDGETSVGMEDDIVARFTAAARRVVPGKVFSVKAAEWLDCAPGVFALPIGEHGVIVLREVDNLWTVERLKGQKKEPISSPSPDVGLVQGVAEAYARERGQLGLSVDRAAWRSMDPTDEQESLLARLDVFYPEGVTRGEADDLITAAKVRRIYVGGR